MDEENTASENMQQESSPAGSDVESDAESWIGPDNKSQQEELEENRQDIAQLTKFAEGLILLSPSDDPVMVNESEERYWGGKLKEIKDHFDLCCASNKLYDDKDLTVEATTYPRDLSKKLPGMFNFGTPKYRPEMGVDYLTHFHGLIAGGIPVPVPGDGNCLYSSVSMLLVGDVHRAYELRARCAFELILNFPHYRFLEGKYTTYTIDCTLENAIELVLYPKGPSGALHVAALAEVIGTDIFVDTTRNVSYLLTQVSRNQAQALNTLHKSRQHRSPYRTPLTVAFTEFGPGAKKRNHYVPVFGNLAPMTLIQQRELYWLSVAHMKTEAMLPIKEQPKPHYFVGIDDSMTVVSALQETKKGPQVIHIDEDDSFDPSLNPTEANYSDVGHNDVPMEEDNVAGEASTSGVDNNLAKKKNLIQSKEKGTKTTQKTNKITPVSNDFNFHSKNIRNCDPPTLVHYAAMTYQKPDWLSHQELWDKMNEARVLDDLPEVLQAPDFFAMEDEVISYEDYVNPPKQPATSRRKRKRTNFKDIDTYFENLAHSNTKFWLLNFTEEMELQSTRAICGSPRMKKYLADVNGFKDGDALLLIRTKKLLVDSTKSDGKIRRIIKVLRTPYPEVRLALDQLRGKSFIEICTQYFISTKVGTKLLAPGDGLPQQEEEGEEKKEEEEQGKEEQEQGKEEQEQGKEEQEQGKEQEEQEDEKKEDQDKEPHEEEERQEREPGQHFMSD